MEQESWKPVVNYEGLYEVSDWGRMKSIPREGTKGGILKPSSDKWGYIHVNLCKKGKRETYKVHILVMRAFNGKIPDGKEIDHIDGNPSNNCLENLRCVPHKENCNNPVTVQRHAEAMQKLSQDPEWRRNVSDAAKRRAQDQKWQQNNAEKNRRISSKPVGQYTLDGVLVNTWTSATDAARELGVNRSCISECCSRKRKSTGGYIWRHIQEKEAV